MAKAPKPTPKPAAKASKASAKPLPKKAPPPPKAKKARGLDPVAADEAADAGVQAAMAEVDDNELPQKPSKKGKPLTEAFAVQEPARAPVPARLVPLSILRPSPTNPRKNLGDLTELAASLASIGQLQPLVVRPHPQEAGALEVVCGHRRFAAAALAKLDELLVVERVLSDREVLEAQLTENGQRSDVHPLEEAAALHRLHRHHRVEVAELAARLGRGAGYVHQRLRLMHLTSKAAEAFEAGRLTFGVALRLARLPEKSQHDALPQVVVPEGATPRQVGDVRWVLDRLHLKLVDSPFALDDESLPGSSCTRCPKRSGNQVALFTEAEGPDLCLDRDCHKAKVEAFGKRRLEEAQAAGKRVLTAEEASKVLTLGGQVAWIAPYVDASEKINLDEDAAEPKLVSLKELLGDKTEVVFAVHEGKLVELLRKEDVHKVLKEQGAPEEVVEEYAPRVDSDDEDDSGDSGETWEERRKREQREAEEQKKRALLLVDKCPVCDPEVFRLAVVGEILDNEWTYREALEKVLGGEEKAGELDLEPALLALPVGTIWKLWLGAVLQADGAPLDEIEKLVSGEPPAPAMRPVEPAPEVDPELLPPSDPRSAVARTPALPLEEPAPGPSLVGVSEPPGGWREARRKVVDILARAKGNEVHVSSIASIKSLPRKVVQAVAHLLDAADAIGVTQTTTDGINTIAPSIHIDLARISEGLWRMTLDYVTGLVEDAAEPPTTAKLAADLELPVQLVADVLDELRDKKRLEVGAVDGLEGERWVVRPKAPKKAGAS